LHGGSPDLLSSSPAPPSLHVGRITSLLTGADSVIL
jgi:hypothetical protein